MSEVTHELEPSRLADTPIHEAHPPAIQVCVRTLASTRKKDREATEKRMSAARYDITYDDHQVLHVDADHYKREDGWVAFKDSNDTIIADIPANRIKVIVNTTAAQKIETETE